MKRPRFTSLMDVLELVDNGLATNEIESSRQSGNCAAEDAVKKAFNKILDYLSTAGYVPAIRQYSYLNHVEVDQYTATLPLKKGDVRIDVILMTRYDANQRTDTQAFDIKLSSFSTPTRYTKRKLTELIANAIK